MNPFIVYALPRSRTAWMAQFLSYGSYRCGHEQAIFLRDVMDIPRLLRMPFTGVVETAAAQGWRVIRHHVPEIKQVVIRRPLQDVYDAMLNVDLHGYATYDKDRLWKAMAYGNRMLDEISALPDTLTLDFSDLDTREGCKTLFEFCLPYQFEDWWWEDLKTRNIQVSVPEYIQYYHEHKADIDSFKRKMWQELRYLAKSGQITRH